MKKKFVFIIDLGDFITKHENTQKQQIISQDKDEGKGKQQKTSERPT